MANDTELFELYGKIRAEVLTRQFAFGRYFRTNYVSESGTMLGNLPDEAKWNSEITAKIVNGNVIDNYKNLLNLDESKQVIERWRIARHKRDNPLIFSGLLFTCLAIEHHLGSLEARTLIWEGLKSIGSLYKFNEEPFKGYILRWDPVTSDKWDTWEDYLFRWEEIPGADSQRLIDFLKQNYGIDWVNSAKIEKMGSDKKIRVSIPTNYLSLTLNDEQKKVNLELDDGRTDELTVKVQNDKLIIYGRAKLLRCGEFLIDAASNRYLYCTPFDAPACPPRGMDDARKQFMDRYRYWEPSMDELAGLILAYDSIYRFLKTDYEIKTEVEAQVNKLGDYLAEHGYILVRPCGGFTWRGAAGALSALEFPFTQVFKRITGKTYESRASFDDAMKKAGVWDSLKDSLTFGSAVGGSFGSLVVAYGFLTASIITFLSGIPIAVLGYATGRFVALMLNQDKFEVKDPSGFAFADVLNMIPTRKQRFLIWLRVAGWGWGGPAAHFPAYIGLTGLDDSDTTVKDGYVSWFSAWPFKYGEGINLRFDGIEDITGIKRGTAVVLGEGQNSEHLLREFLDQAYTMFTTSGPVPSSVSQNLNEAGRLGRKGHLTAIDDGETGKSLVVEDPMDGLDYMVGLALAWLHVKRLRDDGKDVPKDVPNPPFDINTMPSLEVPAEAYCVLGPISEVLFPWASKDDKPSKPVDAFGGPDCSKSDVPEPHQPPALRTETVNVTVPENAPGDVYTGIILDELDTVTIFPNPNAKIWAGVLGTGPNGPEGWARPDYNPKFPANQLPDGTKVRFEPSHPFCLLYRIGTGQYQYAGYNPTIFEVPEGVAKLPLYLRINDDTPGNGNGQFEAMITVIHRTP